MQILQLLRLSILAWFPSVYSQLQTVSISSSVLLPLPTPQISPPWLSSRGRRKTQNDFPIYTGWQFLHLHDSKVLIAALSQPFDLLELLEFSATASDPISLPIYSRFLSYLSTKPPQPSTWTFKLPAQPQRRACSILKIAWSSSPRIRTYKRSHGFERCKQLETLRFCVLVQQQCVFYFSGNTSTIRCWSAVLLFFLSKYCSIYCTPVTWPSWDLAICLSLLSSDSLM